MTYKMIPANYILLNKPYAVHQNNVNLHLLRLLSVLTVSNDHNYTKAS